MNKNVIARLKIKSDFIKQFIETSETLVEQTRNEKGCIIYKMFQEYTNKKNEFLFYEIYKNEKSLEEHNESRHLTEFIKKITPMLEEKLIVEVHDL